MSKLKLTPAQLHELADVLRQLGEITADTGIQFDPYGTWDVQYAGNTVRIGRSEDGTYHVDNYCT